MQREQAEVLCKEGFDAAKVDTSKQYGKSLEYIGIAGSVQAATWDQNIEHYRAQAWTDAS